MQLSDYDTPRVDRYLWVICGTWRQQKPAPRGSTWWAEDQTPPGCILGVRDRMAGLGRRQQHAPRPARGQSGRDAGHQDHRHKHRHHQDLDHPFHRPSSLFLTFLPSTYSRYQTEADDGIVQMNYFSSAFGNLLTDPSGETRSAPGPRGEGPTLLASPWTFQRPATATKRWRPVPVRMRGGPRTGSCTRSP